MRTWIIWAAIGSVLYAQSSQAPAPVPATPESSPADDVTVTAQQAADFERIIRVNTRLVEVDVVVTGANGPVAGLTREDFQIFDNGKRVPVEAFSQREGRVTTRTRNPLPPRAASNRLNNRGEEPAEATVLLWDVLNTEMSDQAWVQSKVVSYLKRLGQDDRVALYRLVKTLSILQDFTADPDRLRRVVERMQPEQSVNLQVPSLIEGLGDVSPILPVDPDSEAGQLLLELVEEMNRSMTTAALEVDWYTTRDRALITLSAMRSIARHLRGIPGRKRLVWISGSFPAFQQTQNTRVGEKQIESLNLGLQIQKAIEELNEANVAVYPVDPRGLTTGFGSMAQSVDYAQTRGGFTASGIDTMNLLAKGTGGRAFYGGNDVVSAMEKIFADYDVTYTLGFRPLNNSNQVEYHDIAVKVARKGVEVRHRRGYYDDEIRVADDRYRRDNISLTMRNELDATGVGLVGWSEGVPDTPGQYRVVLTIDANNLTFQYQQGRWVSLIDFATYFSETPSLSGITEIVLISLGEERYREVLRDGVTVARVVDTGGPEGRLRIAIQDRSTGNIGSVWVPLGITK